MKKKLPPYKYDDLILRPVESQDIDLILEWRNQYDHRIWFNTTTITSKDCHYAWFDKYLAHKDDYIFIITDQNNTKYGQVSIYKIDHKNMRAEFGRFLANPKYEGQGFMKKACYAALALAREIICLKKLNLEVKANNHKAIYIYQQCGFSVLTLKEGMINMEIDL